VLAHGEEWMLVAHNAGAFAELALLELLELCRVR